MRWTMALGLMVACTGDGEGVDTPGDTDTDMPLLSGDTGATSAPGCLGTEPASGVITDAAGSPVVEASIRFCQVICQTDRTDAQGGWCAANAEPGWHALEVRPPEGSGLAVGYVPVQFAAGETRTLDMVLPTLESEVALPGTPTEVEVGTGLFLTVGPDSLTTPDLFPDATGVSGARIAVADMPVVDLPGTPVAMWFLAPFEYHASPAMPVRFSNDLALADATTLEVYVGSYDAQNWVPSGSVTANGDWLEGDATVSVTSTVVLIQP